MQMINEKPHQKEGIQTRYIGGETLLIDGEKSYVINPPVAFVWHLCDGAHSIESMVKAVQDKFKLPPGIDLQREIHHILIDLDHKALLRGS